jgi:hypothetical protein
VILCILYSFTSSTVSDRNTKSGRSAIRFEIVTDHPQELADEIIRKLHHSATLVPAKGMYLGKETNILICVVNKTQIAALSAVIRKYPNTFAIMSNVNEVMGNFLHVTNDGKIRSSIMLTDGNCIHFNNTETGSRYADRYKLPDVTPNKTEDNWYGILTTKTPVTLAQGGTGASGAGNARISLSVPGVQNTSYVGTGTYGSGNPCEITLNSHPRMIVVSKSTNAKDALVMGVWVEGTNDMLINVANNDNICVKCSLTDNTFAWWSTSNAKYQLNESGVTYKVFILRV